MHRDIDTKFESLLGLKNQELITLYKDLRAFILTLYPDANELLYHTHALTSVYSISSKLSNGYCHIPIYNEHLNLGFNKGNLLDDPENLLQGTGKLIRHIPIKQESDYKNTFVTNLIKSAIEFAIADLDKPIDARGTVISKLK
jgi:hypothetical protein